MGIEVGSIGLIAQKEILDARRNRWFLLYTFVFAGLSLALSWLGLSGLRQYGLSGFGRTTASMINLVLLIVPLMGLTLGAMSIASEREKGTLIYMLAQPITHLELLVGKFIGVGLALLGALTIGFGLSGFLIAYYGGTTAIGSYLALVAFTFLLALVALGLGMFISSILPKADAAVGVSLFLWLLLVFFGDLGIMGSTMILNLGIRQVFMLALFNPLQVFKLAAILTLQGNLEVLGPVGVYAVRTYGSHLLPLFIGILVLWIALVFVFTWYAFRQRGAL